MAINRDFLKSDSIQFILRTLICLLYSRLKEGERIVLSVENRKLRATYTRTRLVEEEMHSEYIDVVEP